MALPERCFQGMISAVKCDCTEQKLSVESFGYICEDQSTGPLCRALGSCQSLGVGAGDGPVPSVVQQLLFQQVVLFLGRVEVVHRHQLVPQLL